MKENLIATARLEAARSFNGEKLDSSKLDPALRIPVHRMDGWANLGTGFGTKAGHAVANSEFERIDRIPNEELENMYRSDWVTRKGIDIPAEDMTRKGISYKHNDDDEDKQKIIEDFNDVLETDFLLWLRTFQAIALSRISGGSLTLFNFNDIQTQEQFKDPLNENQVTEIRWIKIIPSWFAIPITFYRDINNPKWGQPEHYQIVIREPSFGTTIICHESRAIRLDGRFTTQTPRTENRGWNDSEIQAVYTALRDYGICVVSSNNTMESFIQDYLGMKGLAEKVMMRETDVVLDRIFLAHQKMHSGKLALYDAESEQMQRQGTPITGLADLWDRYTEAICGAWEIPRSRFMSSESGALGGNAAESDTRNYFDRIRSKQKLSVKPYLSKFMYFVNLALKMVEEIPDFTFNPLHEQSEKEKAESRYTQSQTDSLYIDRQVVTPEEVALSRFSKKEPDIETMNIDWEAREELAEAEETTEEEKEEMREILNRIEQNQINNGIKGEEKSKKVETELPNKTKLDSKTIYVLDYDPED